MFSHKFSHMNVKALISIQYVYCVVFSLNKLFAMLTCSWTHSDWTVNSEPNSHSRISHRVKSKNLRDLLCIRMCVLRVRIPHSTVYRPSFFSFLFASGRLFEFSFPFGFVFVFQFSFFGLRLELVDSSQHLLTLTAYHHTHTYI